MQGLFPPSTITNSTTASELDPTNILQDGSYVATPGNVQYPSVYTAGQADADSIYLDSANYCPAWYNEYESYYNSLLAAPQPKNQDLYQQVANSLSNDVLSSAEYTYANADSVYDYINDQYQYNSTVHTALSNGDLATESAYANLRYNSDSLNTAIYASPSTSPVNTIAGSGLATQILRLFELNIGTLGQLNKLSILIGDFAPLLSFFALAALPQSSGDNFLGLPQYGSLAIFELYAFVNGADYQNTTSPFTGTPLSYPQTDDLYVRFLFANGSDDTTATSSTLSPESLQLQEYPLFVTSPSAGPQLMTWNEFSTAMSRISVSSFAEWCSICDAWETSIFCLANNSTAWNDLYGPHDHHYDPRSNWLAPAVAGTIGALVTLAVLGLALVLAFCIGGFGFSRRREPVWARNNKHKLGLGGFKGGRKMASDADLTVTKGGAGINAVEKERVGSWELKPDPQSPNMDGVARHGAVEDRGAQQQVCGAAPVQTQEQMQEHEREESVISSARTSIDRDDLAVNPFQNPVLPHERV